jgi:C4-dicarboxylate transporter, DctQ subunit
MRMAGRIFDYILSIMAWLGAIICVFMMLSISADVIARYFLKRPILGMQEANTMLIVWIVFLGSAWLLKKNGHINMDIILQIVSPRVQNRINLVLCLICAAVNLVLFWFSTQAVLEYFRKGILETGNLRINTGWILLAIPIGTLPFCIQFLRKAYGHWMKLRLPAPEIPAPGEITTAQSGGK